MLLYINSRQRIKLGNQIEIPKYTILFQESFDAQCDLEMENKEDDGYTYKIIVDEKFHDPFVLEQTKYIYKPNELGKYYCYTSDFGLEYDDFFNKITDTRESRDIFSTDELLEQIDNFGFSGVFIFMNEYRSVITTRSIQALIIGRIHKGKSLYL
jgi:hypothetical protein